MLRKETLVKINSAIHACLDRCYDSDAPLSTMAEFVSGLRSRPDWREAEVEEVETAVRRVLQAVLRHQPEPRMSR